MRFVRPDDQKLSTRLTPGARSGPRVFVRDGGVRISPVGRLMFEVHEATRCGRESCAVARSGCRSRWGYWQICGAGAGGQEW